MRKEGGEDVLARPALGDQEFAEAPLGKHHHLAELGGGVTEKLGERLAHRRYRLGEDGEAFI